MDVFTSLLYADENGQTAAAYNPPVDGCVFEDLHIAQIVADVATEGYKEFSFDEFYQRRPARLRDAEFRAEIARNLWDGAAREKMTMILAGLLKTRRFLETGAKIHAAPIRHKWKLDAAVEYVGTVGAICALPPDEIYAEGLSRVRGWLRGHAETGGFKALRDAALSVKAMADEVSYSLEIDLYGNAVRVGGDSGEGDVCAGFAKVFDRYDLSAVSLDIVAFADVNMNALELRVLDYVKSEHPKLMGALADFDSRFGGFVHEKLAAFEREALFYISYIDFAKRLERKGFKFALPRYSHGHRLRIAAGFDASLALVRGAAQDVVHNDFEIGEGERSFLLTGPNQGGKTTFSRMFGQILYFSSLGLPVPCAEAEVPWVNGLKTHFNVEENPGDGAGRLKEELRRLRRILASAPDNSAVILNELFSSATTFDAVEMGGRILEMFERKQCVCLYITHIYGLAANGKAVSLVAETADGPAPAFTYKIKRAESAKNAFAERLLAGRRLRAADIAERARAAPS